MEGEKMQVDFLTTVLDAVLVSAEARLEVS